MKTLRKILEGVKQYPDNAQGFIEELALAIKKLPPTWYEDIMFPVNNRGQQLVITGLTLRESVPILRYEAESGKKEKPLAEEPSLLVPLLENLIGYIDAQAIDHKTEEQRKKENEWVNRQIEESFARKNNR